jgi:hypothetical protein
MKKYCLTVIAAAGMLAESSAHANWQSINPATYASRFRPDAPTASPAKPEVQVAIMAEATTANNGKKVAVAHPWGSPRPYASHSH